MGEEPDLKAAGSPAQGLSLDAMVEDDEEEDFKPPAPAPEPVAKAAEAAPAAPSVPLLNNAFPAGTWRRISVSD